MEASEARCGFPDVQSEAEEIEVTPILWGASTHSSDTFAQGDMLGGWF